MDDLDALLADLQAIPIGGSQKTTRDPKDPPPPLPTENDSSRHTSISLGSNLSELDSLLEDLNITTHPKGESNSVDGVSDKYINDPQQNRQPVESLLSELDSAVINTLQQSNESPSQDSNSPNKASSATKELDDLMASLSDFKVNVQTVAPAHSVKNNDEYAKPQRSVSSNKTQQGSQPVRTSQLDSMLGSLQSDMNRQGVSTVKKGICAACNKPIVGQVVTALGKTWHPEHFACVVCELPLGSRNFFERDGKPYCEKDYHELYAPRCAYCNQPILDSCVTALDKTWHQECFFCHQCGKQFGDSGFHERDGKPFCRDCYFAAFAPKCGGCDQPIMNNYIAALGQHWHQECFVCYECHEPFQGGSFFEHEGKPYCEMHYHSKRGTLCYNCQKPITGRCITAMHLYLVTQKQLSLRWK
ncbi:paxillin-like isoform X3 [Xenia sp. Carnegie-2017]|uniref:paxillin-like isoform X3 n=1 Tax=Xenia sp. Carnegie-2017 TaxID=2897299 RepID=UPI001F0405DC|nr:paxillin-like isoform X3 [Xenia sp. Carnegie-2017]